MAFFKIDETSPTSANAVIPPTKPVQPETPQDKNMEESTHNEVETDKEPEQETSSGYTLDMKQEIEGGDEQDAEFERY